MEDAVALVPSFAAGALLGAAFFWALWLTVQGIARAERPALLVLGSLVLRFGLLLLGLYGLLRFGGWPHALAGTLGFMVSRLVVVRWTSPSRPKKARERTPPLGPDPETTPQTGSRRERS